MSDVLNAKDRTYKRKQAAKIIHRGRTDNSALYFEQTSQSNQGVYEGNSLKNTSQLTKLNPSLNISCFTQRLHWSKLQAKQYSTLEMHGD